MLEQECIGFGSVGSSVREHLASTKNNRYFVLSPGESKDVQGSRKDMHCKIPQLQNRFLRAKFFEELPETCDDQPSKSRNVLTQNFVEEPT